jgi:hypothetical protein
MYQVYTIFFFFDYDEKFDFVENGCAINNTVFFITFLNFFLIIKNTEHLENL